MKADQLIQHLDANRIVFQSLLTGKEPDEYHFRPDEKS